jgi:C4-dicarboxylate transporter DctQ subunit
MLNGTLNDQAWYEVNDIPMWGFLRFIEDGMNQGEAYEKLPRFIPYAALPLGMLLLTLRFAQQAFRVLAGEIDTIIASHEVEELLAETTPEADR